MQFDIDKMGAIDRYELLLGTVVPRPMLWLQRFQVTERLTPRPTAYLT